VPFTWTLRLVPVWLLYVGLFAALLYVLDRRAYARESPAAALRDRSDIEPVSVLGLRNALWLAAIVAAALLPRGYREGAIVLVAILSYVGTPGEVRRRNDFSFGPIVEVAVLFAGLFICLAPVETLLADAAPRLHVGKAWHLFWTSGALSAVLDNAPTYAAFSALARGLSHGAPELVAGITPLKLAAISSGTVVMGATTYIGNGPNLIIKAIAEANDHPMPSFGRYALFAIATMLPAHLILTGVLAVLEP
jgi:Na+/H+ antiporter NhaD/arsenite permease-like protein